MSTFLSCSWRAACRGGCLTAGTMRSTSSSLPRPHTPHAGMGGPCKDYSDRPIAAAAPQANGTAMFDNEIDYSRWSRLKGALGAPAFSG